MNKAYAIPIALVSVVSAATVGSMLLPEKDVTIDTQSIITENISYGFDFEYMFSVPEIPQSANLIVRLPDAANTNPIALYTDDSGQREFYEPQDISGKVVVYPFIPEGSYTFVYTSANENDQLQPKDVFIQE